jgi:hypothetical protein
MSPRGDALQRRGPAVAERRGIDAVLVEEVVECRPGDAEKLRGA